MKLERTIGLSLLALSLAIAPRALAQQKAPGMEHEGAAFTFNKIAEGIYHVVGTGSMNVGANSTVVVYEDGVLLVDDHSSPAAAAVLLDDMRAVTGGKPLKYVVDTHFHYDHAHGNQVIPSSASIIGSEFTREMLASGASKTSLTWRFGAPQPTQITALKAQLDTAKAPADRAALERRIRILQAYGEAISALTPVPPSITLDHRMTLQLGSREVRILFLGRAHTGGDVVVYLPRERILIGGDVVSTQPSNMLDAYVPDWINTLDELKKLQYDIILPGHGPAFKDTVARIDAWQSYLRDFLAQVTAQKKSGATVDVAAQRIDLRSHAKDYPQIRAIGADRDVVARIYDILDGKVK